MAYVKFSKGDELKKRPVVIISNNDFNFRNPEVICCPITSNPLQEGVVTSSEDLDQGRLKMVSKIKSQYPFFIEKGEIHKEIGILNAKVFEQIIRDINNLIKID